jgi:hypothetical protein
MRHETLTEDEAREKYPYGAYFCHMRCSWIALTEDEAQTARWCSVEVPLEVPIRHGQYGGNTDAPWDNAIEEDDCIIKRVREGTWRL